MKIQIEMFNFLNENMTTHSIQMEGNKIKARKSVKTKSFFNFNLNYLKNGEVSLTVIGSGTKRYSDDDEMLAHVGAISLFNGSNEVHDRLNEKKHPGKSANKNNGNKKINNKIKTNKVLGINLVKVTYGETNNGLSYESTIEMDGERIGRFENDGNGGLATIYTYTAEKRKEFNSRMNDYFNNIIGLNTNGISQCSIEDTFVEHLLDYKELGRLNPERKLKFTWA